MSTQDRVHRVLSVFCGVPADMGVDYFGQDPFPVDPALSARPTLNFTLGPGIRDMRNKELVALVKNNVALDPNVAVIVFTVHTDMWNQERRRLIIQGLPLGVEVVKVRVVDPARQIEASVTCYNNTYGNPTFSSSFVGPINQLDAQEVERVSGLPDLHHLIIRPPIPQQPVVGQFSDSLLQIVEGTRQLKTIVLTADLSVRLEGILSSLQDHKSLNSLHITPATFINRARVTQVSGLLLENALIHGLENLTQIEELAIPVEVCTPLLLGALARLTSLRVLKIWPSSILSPSENTSLFRVVQREISYLPDFGQLRVLDVHATSGTSSYAFLNFVFPNTTIL